MRKYHGKECCLFLNSTSIKTLPRGSSLAAPPRDRLRHCITRAAYPNLNSSKRGKQMFQKYKVPLVAFAVVWLSMVACTLTQEPSATTIAVSPVRMISKATSPTPLPFSICHVKTNVINGQLNLRTGPGTQYAVIVVLHEGDAFTASTSTHDWIFAKTNDHQGWINSHYTECNNTKGG